MGGYLSPQDLEWEISERVIEMKDKAFIEREKVINANQFTSKGRESKNPIRFFFYKFWYQQTIGDENQSILLGSFD